MAGERKADLTIPLYKEVEEILNGKKVDANTFSKIARKLKNVNDAKEQEAFFQSADFFERQIQSGIKLTGNQFCMLALIYLHIPRFSSSEKMDHKRKAVEYYRQAIHVDPQNSIAWIGLGDRYTKGDGVDKDAKRGFYYYLRATEVDPENSAAWHKLGRCYFKGNGVDKDAKKSFDCTFKATQLDPQDSCAWNNLGYYYAQGDGVDKDAKKAFDCYLKATQFDPQNSMAWHNLGFYYAKGAVVDKDAKNAEECYWKSVECGGMKALQNIKILLKNGENVNVSRLAKQTRQDYLNGSQEWKAEAKETIRLLQKNPHLLTPEASYYLAIATQSAKAVRDLFEKKHDDVVFSLFQEDLKENNQSACNTMKAFVEGYGIGNTSERQQIAAAVVLKELELGEFKPGELSSLPKKSLDILFKLNPQFLTPEQNFNIGLFLYNFKHNEVTHHELLTVFDESKKGFSGKLMGYFSQREIKDDTKAALSAHTYTFLQTAAEHRNMDARRLLSSIATSRMIDKEMKPFSYLDYIKTDDLFKNKTFNEFFNAVKGYRPDEKKEVKAVHPSSFFHHDEKKSFDAAFEDLRKEFHLILEMKEVQASIEQSGKRDEVRGSLAQVQDLFQPGLDKELNSAFANELQVALLGLPEKVQAHFDPLINQLSFFGRKLR